MTRQPVGTLQANLDAAAMLHPESRTLRDFRAPAWFPDAEAEALQAAERLITPHTYLASLFPHRATLLPWTLPDVVRVIPTGAQAYFPGPTVARKGAYELREAARQLDLEIVLGGGDLEERWFWEGLRVRRLLPHEDWLGQATVVVQPAFVEDRPRALLRALAAGIPVIATERCGLPAQPGLKTVPCGDAEAVMRALRETVTGQ